MAGDIRIRPAGGIWSVRAGGAVLVESEEALELTEGDLPPVIYFPRGDIAMAFLDESDHEREDPAKGTARFFSIVTKSTTLENAAWSYEAPAPAASDIAGYVAFQPSDKVTVEEI